MSSSSYLNATQFIRQAHLLWLWAHSGWNRYPYTIRIMESCVWRPPGDFDGQPIFFSQFAFNNNGVFINIREHNGSETRPSDSFIFMVVLFGFSSHFEAFVCFLAGNAVLFWHYPSCQDDDWLKIGRFFSGREARVKLNIHFDFQFLKFVG